MIYMKKYSAVFISVITIMIIAVVFSSCGIKNSKKKDNSSSESSNAQLGSADLPTVTDENGNTVDYSLNITDPVDDGVVQSPYLSIGTLKDINNKAGTNIKSPEGLEATNEEFDLDDTVSPKIAEYSFMVNGKDYTVKASRKTGSMLIKIYLPDGTAVGDGLETAEELAPVQYDNFCIARWFNDGVQYNMYAENVTLSEFNAVYSKIK